MRCWRAFSSSVAVINTVSTVPGSTGPKLIIHRVEVIVVNGVMFAHCFSGGKLVVIASGG